MSHIYLPGWGWIIAIMALFFFYATNRSHRNRRANNRQRYEDWQRELLDLLRKKKERDNNKSESESK